MNIQNWIQNNKGKAAAIAGGGVLFMMHRGHQAAQSADITSSDGTADGATADGEHVQLVPVSTAPAEYSGGNLDSPQPIQDLNNAGDIPYPVEIGGDLNAPLTGITPTAPVNGVAASGTIAAAAATKSATRPNGHPGYTTKTSHHAPKKSGSRKATQHHHKQTHKPTEHPHPVADRHHHAPAAHHKKGHK